jgi:hypothetical protein
VKKRRGTLPVEPTQKKSKKKRKQNNQDKKKLYSGVCVCSGWRWRMMALFEIYKNQKKKLGQKKN